MKQRLIDANALMEAIRTDVMGGLNYESFIKEAPTIDAVPVVRCKYCVHCEKETMFCTIFMANRMPTDYCSEGERKDNE